MRIFLWPVILISLGCTHTPPEPINIEPLTYSKPETSQALFTLPADGKLKLADAIYLSLQQNRDLAVRKLEPAIQSAAVLNEISDFSPELYGSTRYGEETSSETSRSTGERFSVEGRSRDTEMGLRKQLQTGTNIDLSLTESLDESNRAPTQQELRASLNLTQSLLRGRGGDVNRLALRQAELDVEVSVEELRAYSQALIAETEIAYWQLQLAGEAVRITRKALEVAEQNLSAIQQQIEVGQMARDEEIAALAEVSSRKQNRIDAVALLERRQLQLQQLLAVDGELPFPLEPVTPLEIARQEIQDPQAFIDVALALNPSLREARVRLLQNELELVRTRNGLLPKLDFFTALAKTGFGGNLSAAADQFSEDTYEWSAGLRFLLELGVTANEADQQTAVLERVQGERALDNLENQIRHQIRLAVLEHNLALAQIAAGKETLALRIKTAEAEQARFDVGTSTSLLVAQAQREVLESQIAELENRINYRISLVRLQELTGSLLNSYGVEVSR